MTVTVEFLLLILALGMTYISTRTTYWILKVFSGFAWLGLNFYLVANPITTDDSLKNIIYMTLWGITVVCWFWPFWTTKVDGNGRETGLGRLRLPFMRTDSQEEELQKSRYSPSRYERNSQYLGRINDAMNGRRRR